MQIGYFLFFLISSGYVYASFCLVFGVKTVDPIKAASTPYMGSAEFFYARFVGVWNNCPIIIYI